MHANSIGFTYHNNNLFKKVVRPELSLGCLDRKWLFYADRYWEQHGKQKHMYEYKPPDGKKK